jgi:hypothetical protein
LPDSRLASPGAAGPLSTAVLLAVALACTVILLVIYLGPVEQRLAGLGYPRSNFTLRYLGVTLLGALVGYSEVVLRYRDEPLRATVSLPGVVFVLLNGAVAAFALLLVEYFAAPGARGNVVQRVLLTGIGAMVVLRGKLLTVPTPGGGQAELGFAPLVEAILASVNRFIDRDRAFERLQIVAPMARRIVPLGFGRLAPSLRVGLQSLQTLDAEIQDKVAEQIGKLQSDPLYAAYSDCAKLEAIGYDLLNNFGRRCFEEVFRQAELSARRDADAARTNWC